MYSISSTIPATSAGTGALRPRAAVSHAQLQMDWAAVLPLANQEGKTWLMQSRSLPDEDLATRSRARSSVRVW